MKRVLPEEKEIGQYDLKLILDEATGVSLRTNR